MVLATVGRLGQPTLKELAEEEQVKPATITKVAEALTTAGLIERSVDPSDRRVSRVALTPAGRRTLKTVREARTNYLAQQLVGVDAERLASAVDLLEAMAR